MTARPPAHIAEAFVAMAHSIVWATAATVEPDNRPRTRILHPLWDWDGGTLSGVVATGPTAAKSADIAHSPHASFSYWAPNQDTCRADCEVEWATDDATCREVWDRLLSTPEPVGYDPAIIPAWAEGPQSPAFTVWKLTPYRLRVLPGTVLSGSGGELMAWQA